MRYVYLCLCVDYVMACAGRARAPWRAAPRFLPDGTSLLLCSLGSRLVFRGLC